MSPYPGPGMPPGLTSGIPLHNYMNQQLSGHGMSPQPPSQVNSGQGMLQPPPVHHSPRPNSTGAYRYSQNLLKVHGSLSQFQTTCVFISLPSLILIVGGMIEMGSSSPAPNGYHHRASPCPSPGAMVNRQSRQSPPSRGPPMGRPMMTNSHDGLMSPDVQVIKILIWSFAVYRTFRHYIRNCMYIKVYYVSRKLFLYEKESIYLFDN